MIRIEAFSWECIIAPFVFSKDGDGTLVEVNFDHLGLCLVKSMRRVVIFFVRVRPSATGGLKHVSCLRKVMSNTFFEKGGASSAERRVSTTNVNLVY